MAICRGCRRRWSRLSAPPRASAEAKKKEDDPSVVLSDRVRASLRPRRTAHAYVSSPGSKPGHPPGGGYLKTTQNGAAARPRFESPVRRAAVVLAGTRLIGPFDICFRVAAAASGPARGCRCTFARGWSLHPTTFYG